MAAGPDPGPVGRGHRRRLDAAGHRLLHGARRPAAAHPAVRLRCGQPGRRHDLPVRPVQPARAGARDSGSQRHRLRGGARPARLRHRAGHHLPQARHRPGAGTRERRLVRRRPGDGHGDGHHDHGAGPRHGHRRARRDRRLRPVHAAARRRDRRRRRDRDGRTRTRRTASTPCCRASRSRSRPAAPPPPTACPRPRPRRRARLRRTSITWPATTTAFARSCWTGSRFVTPAWTERHAADLGIVLAEILAYAADHLSYAQDAVGTEAYLRTARSRISVRRLAWLLDYRDRRGLRGPRPRRRHDPGRRPHRAGGHLFYPARPGLPVAAQSGDPAAALLAGTGPAFYSLIDLAVATEQNAISFYSWGDDDYCLPAGATSATFKDQLTSLAAGTLLIFEEVLGPGTGVAGDADPAHRCAVLLTSVRYSDYRDRPLADPVAWHAGHRGHLGRRGRAAVPARREPPRSTGTRLAGVSLARGNVVPAEHGTQITGEQLAPVPATGRYYPQLASSPLSFRAPIAPSPAGTTWSASSWTTTDAADATPVISLTDSESPPRTWTPQSDLLSSGPADTCFVPEVEGDGTAWLRFGDGEHGLQPNSTLTFTASYRIGNGSAGNIGQDVLGQAVFIAPSPPALPFPVAADQRRPQPAAGHQRRRSRVDRPRAAGRAVLVPAAEAVRHRGRLRQQAARCPASARRAARCGGPGAGTRRSCRWTRRRVGTLSGPMDQLRMLGTDVAAEGAVIVGLRIALAVCVDAEHFRGDVLLGADGPLYRAGRAAERGELHLRPDGLRQPADRRRAGHRRRRIRHAGDVLPAGRRPGWTGWRPGS